ncbi:MAG: endonuclease/exonuclease/phosphatase family protein [Roseitalea sp.]|jgi:endonuclease/exonuclease/phosphatase family metal-dependent hydrolase|nr:endonuclease/exonuclease/phosphatase family protein [Roseitalea sp.]MBO6721550.1 endonuclease/exonuclease/phosphatase family protein [Roseitalea sp.]MBO6743306.1 endonuclease/exonuclease/phosphatase family protein [Roseitalea sp.]
MTVRAVTYNIQYGFGLDGRYDLDRVVDAVRDADIVCLQEVTRGYIKNGGVDMPAALFDALPGHFGCFHPAGDLDMGSALAEGRAVNRRFQFGNMILSRWPLTTVRGHLLPRTWRKDTLNLQRGALEAQIFTPAGLLRVYSLHLDHIDPRERMMQVRALKSIALDFAKTGGAISGGRSFGVEEIDDRGDFLLMGDFNFEPRSDEYRLMTEDESITDVTTADQGWTWRTPHAAEKTERSRLDYAFCNLALAPRISNLRIDRDAEGSDHMPVWVDIAAG